MKALTRMHVQQQRMPLDWLIWVSYQDAREGIAQLYQKDITLFLLGFFISRTNMSIRFLSQHLGCKAASIDKEYK